MRRSIVLIVALLIAVPALYIGGSGHHQDGQLTLSTGSRYLIECPTSFVEHSYQVSPGIWDVTCSASAAPTPTNTPAPTNTPTSGHDTTVWHGPSGQTHEHGAAPPSWLPTSGPCAIAFDQMAIGREGHNFYKGYEGVTSNGVRIYIVNHVAPNLMGRSHGDHDETIVFMDRSGNYSCWQGIGNYSPTSDPTDPITVFVKACDGGGPQGPIILVACSLASESWYEAPGFGFCDNSTHVNGVWEDINGVNRGDGGSRHMEIQCYRDRLPGRGAVQVAATLAQDCVVAFNICQYRAVTPFAFNYAPGSLTGPN